ncbi:MAG: MaoC family dehydratase [Dehalococcoidales bacterium]|nr:MaoC family dehydratase [Dehalococcoidales bacterium]
MAQQEVSILDKLGVGIGYKTSHTKTVTEADIVLTAGISGDFNPIHVNEEYAKKTFFGGRIAHGVFSLLLLSTAMAKYPGLVIFLSQSVKFMKPVKIGDTVTAIAEVIDARKDKGIITIKNTCLNQRGEVVVEGEAACRLYAPPA